MMGTRTVPRTAQKKLSRRSLSVQLVRPGEELVFVQVLPRGHRLCAFEVVATMASTARTTGSR